MNSLLLTRVLLLNNLAKIFNFSHRNVTEKLLLKILTTLFLNEDVIAKFENQMNDFFLKKIFVFYVFRSLNNILSPLFKSQNFLY